MLEYVIAILLVIVLGYAFLKGCTINFNITVKQEFSAEDRQLLEDLYNKEGDPDPNYDMKDSIDEVLKEVNNIMLDREDEIDG